MTCSPVAATSEPGALTGQHVNLHGREERSLTQSHEREGYLQYAHSTAS